MGRWLFFNPNQLISMSNQSQSILSDTNISPNPNSFSSKHPSPLQHDSIPNIKESEISQSPSVHDKRQAEMSSNSIQNRESDALDSHKTSPSLSNPYSEDDILASLDE